MVFAIIDGQGVMAYADPAAVGAVVSAPPRAAASAPPPMIADPFTVVRSFSWATTGLAIPLGLAAGPDGDLYILDTKPSVIVFDPRTGRVVRGWGGQGSGNGQFDLTVQSDNPGNGDITVTPDGRVYVADGSNHRVQVFDATGRYLSQFGSFGTGLGQFSALDEIASGIDGSLAVLDVPSNRITKFTHAGKVLWQSPPATSAPNLGAPLHGIVVRPDGSVIASCEGCEDHLLQFGSSDGSPIAPVPASGIGSTGGVMDTDPAGNIYLETYDQTVFVLDPKGKLLGARYLAGGIPTTLGKTVTWGDQFWPSPVFAPDGHGYSFNRLGLLQLAVKLPKQ
jgi:hypothetical protein